MQCSSPCNLRKNHEWNKNMDKEISVINLLIVVIYSWGKVIIDPISSLAGGGVLAEETCQHFTSFA